jgi:hypothetical protein
MQHRHLMCSATVTISQRAVFSSIVLCICISHEKQSPQHEHYGAWNYTNGRIIADMCAHSMNRDL